MNLEMFSQLIEEDTAFRTVVANCFYLVNQKLDFLIGKVSIETPEEPQPQTMNIPAAAKYINVAEVTLRGYLRDRIIPYSQLVKGGTITIQKSDLDNYLSATRKKTKAEITEIADNLLGAN